MNRKLCWGLGVLIILIIGAGVFVLVKNRAEIQRPKTELEITQKQPEANNKAEEVAQEQPPIPEGDFHDDGTFHDDAPPDPVQQDDTQQIDMPDNPKVQYTVPKGAVTKPNFPKVDPKADPVQEAYKRLEYIKNNPYAWGGVHSPRATELIAALLPAELAADHSEGDERSVLIYELCQQGDPRAAEALIAHMVDGGVGWVVMDDALEEIGPPAVPYILPYLEREETYGSDWIVIHHSVIDSLTRIGVRYRDDLGSIVEHIIIPKFKEIAADKNNKGYYHTIVSDAQKALDRLQ